MNVMNAIVVTDTLSVMRRDYPRRLLSKGSTLIESPIFDALAAEYFASDVWQTRVQRRY